MNVLTYLHIFDSLIDVALSDETFAIIFKFKKPISCFQNSSVVYSNFVTQRPCVIQWFRAVREWYISSTSFCEGRRWLLWAHSVIRLWQWGNQNTPSVKTNLRSICCNFTKISEITRNLKQLRTFFDSSHFTYNDLVWTWMSYQFFQSCPNAITHKMRHLSRINTGISRYTVYITSKIKSSTYHPWS